MSGILLRGDWGQSMEWRRPVKDLIWERMALTVVLSLIAILVSWFIAIPVGVFSATHQYSILDYIFSALSFIGVGYAGFHDGPGGDVGGDEPVWAECGRAILPRVSSIAPWSWAKVVDMLKHLWIPVI